MYTLCIPNVYKSTFNFGKSDPSLSASLHCGRLILLSSGELYLSSHYSCSVRNACWLRRMACPESIEARETSVEQGSHQTFDIDEAKVRGGLEALQEEKRSSETLFEHFSCFMRHSSEKAISFNSYFVFNFGLKSRRGECLVLRLVSHGPAELYCSKKLQSSALLYTFSVDPE